MKAASFIALLLAFSYAASVSAQDTGPGHGAPTPLSDAVAEAENNNAQIAAAYHAWHASAHVVQQLTALSDLQFAADGSGAANPKSPVAGHGGSDAIYNEVTASQKLPHPTEMRLRGEAAQRQTETQHARIAILRSNIVDQVKTIYLRLSYLYQMYDLDDRGAADLAVLIQNELSKYSVGMGSQAEVLQAQLERIKLLRETTLHHEEVGGLQATLKALLHRLPDSPDIIPEQISVTPLKRAAGELLLKTASQNPTLKADAKTITAQSAQLEAAKTDSNPDFNLGYTFAEAAQSENGGYILTSNLQLPGGKGINAEVAATREKLESLRSQASEDLLRQLAEVQKQYVIVTSSDELMRECKEGLIPQSKAVFESKLAGYKSDREKFGPVIEAFVDELTFENDYLQALLDHETALAHLEALTGESLR